MKAEAQHNKGWHCRPLHAAVRCCPSVHPAAWLMGMGLCCNSWAEAQNVHIHSKTNIHTNRSSALLIWFCSHP
jgi:hypothetical protein